MSARTNSLRWAVLLVPLLLIPVADPVLATVQLPSAGVQGFNIMQVSWGTSTTHVSAGPNMQDVPLTLTLQYVYSLSATSTQLSLQLPSGFTDYNGNPTAESFIAGSITTNSIEEVTFYLDVESNASLGTYSFPLDVNWTVALSSETSQMLYEQNQATVYLKGTANLAFQTIQESATADQVNSIILTLENTGSGKASDISTTASAQGATILNQPSTIAYLNPGYNASENLSLFIPSSAADSALLLTLTSTYVDPYNNTDTSTTSVGLLVGSTKTGADLSFQVTQKSLLPNDVNEMTVIVTNTGTTIEQGISTTVSASGGATILTQPSNIATLDPGSSANDSLSLFVPTSASDSALTLTFSSSYVGINNDTYTVSASIGLLVASSTASSSPPATEEPISLVVAGDSLVAGETSTVSFVIKNIGDESMFSPEISFSASSPIVVVANSTRSFAGDTIAPGSTLSFSSVVSSATSAAGGVYAGTLTVVYVDPSNNSETETLSVGLTLVDQAPQISVKALSTTISVGASSPFSFVVTNTGNVPLYSPSFALSTPSSLAVLANSTFAKSGMVLNPGESFTYEVTVSNGPKTAEGPYAGTLTVTYSDQFGNSHTLSATVGFVVVASVEFVIQSETVSQSGTTITISGTILNEGQGSAYYLDLVVNATVGSRNVGSGSYYVGEVDPNTPTAFSITVTISPTLLAGATGSTSATVTTTSITSETFSVSTANSTTTTSSSSDTTITSASTRSFPGNFTGTFTGTGNFTLNGTRTQTFASTSDPPSSTTLSTSTSSTFTSPSPIVTLTLSGNYQNDFGQVASYDGPLKTLALTTANQTGTSSVSPTVNNQSQDVDYARIALILVVGLALVGSIVYLRRTRRSGRAISAHPEPEKEDEVI